jgi:hypothetical protein
MNKILLALALFAVSWSANAVTLVLVSHQTTAQGGVASLYTNGETITGGASTAIWSWDGTILSSTGLYSATSAIHPGSTILSDQITDLNIDTSTSSAGGTAAYACLEGTFLASVSNNGCGGYAWGTNGIDESSVSYGPGLTASLTLGGDDTPAGALRTIAAFDYGLDGVTGTGLALGDAVYIGTGIALGSTGGERMTFTVVPVPAAAWLFGSALGLLGWMRRRAA